MLPLLFIGYGSLTVLCLTGLTLYYTMPRRLLDILQKRNDVVFRFPDCKKKIFLTIDDTPTKYTTQILDILDKYNVKASFFVINKDTKDFDDQIRDIHQRGHEICNHTSHTKASIRLENNEFEHSVNKCSSNVETITGQQPKWFRPGSGLWNRNITNFAKENGMQTVLGDVYPHDAHIPFSFINSWYIKRFVQDGSIIIIHDRWWTLSLLESVIPDLLSRGFVFAKLSDEK
jgi:peptidoglycan/xylan/chitin deacetylase (PgdA/CDA1 family)